MSTLEVLFNTDEQRWQAVSQRNSSARPYFVAAVTTTKIYCRAGCRVKLPLREHVRYYETWQAAEQSGFRPCKRCNPRQLNPDDPSLALIQRACREIELADREPSLTDLARQAGMSPTHFQRVFKRLVGISPKQFAVQKKLERAQAQLQSNTSVVRSIYDAGYSSSSRFYTEVPLRLGMQPKEYQRGAPGMTIHYGLAPCYLGWIIVAATERGICAIEFGDAPGELEARLKQRFPQAEKVASRPEFDQWLQNLLAYLEKPQGALDLPLDVLGTVFQHRVWQALRTIPSGMTVTYGEIARQIEAPKAVRAVAQACAANPVVVAVPCHRVVPKTGGPGGYRYGTERKKKLLERERAEV